MRDDYFAIFGRRVHNMASISNPNIQTIQTPVQVRTREAIFT